MTRQPIYQFKVELLDFKPKIWRTFEVLGNAKISMFSYLILAMYKTQGYHLFNLEVNSATNPEINGMIFEFLPEENPYPSDIYGGREILDPTSYTLKEVTKDPGTFFTVNYDFGDDWYFRAELIKVYNDQDADTALFPRILKGQGYGIVEDCGGTHGLSELRTAFKVKKGPEYLELKEWLGRSTFNIDKFDLEEMNQTFPRIVKLLKRGYER
ncbi:MAG: plasmid pRiA4b ORF-3 family protein [Deltaproteobacteria bacterium]|jgi:hypothetical protein|nr:plasmid pRiA4b ORF-3 family protein [Deltaproteobacteria bacterium]